MSLELRLENNFLNFEDGMPSRFSEYILPQAELKQSSGPWGECGFQEIKTSKYHFRHFLFYLQRSLSFHKKESNRGLQSLLNLQGEVECKTEDSTQFKLKERECTLFHTNSEESVYALPGHRVCSFINAVYSPEAYKEFFQLFPQFEKELKENATKNVHYFSFPPVPARYTVLDAIQAIWFDKYIDVLVKKHIEIRMESTLFTLLAQTYTISPIKSISTSERELALEARNLIIKDIKVHFTPKQLASQLHCSTGWLKKAFSKVYGVGLFNFLRTTRMELAKKMLLEGETLKAVAIEVGMKPSNFPREFKSYFGYTVSELKKGQV